MFLKMDIWSILIIGVAVTVDGFFAGFAHGLRNVRITGFQLLHAGAWTVPMTMSAVLAAKYVGHLLPLGCLPVAGGLLLMLAGALALSEALHTGHGAHGENRRIRTSEAALLGIAVAADASVAAFSLGLLGASPVLVPLVFAGLHLGLIFAGNRIGRMGVTGLANVRARMLPGILLITLGGIKLFT